MSDKGEKTVLIYKGRKLYGKNQIGHAYQVEDSDEEMLFKTKLIFAVVGYRIECVRIGESVKGPYKVLGRYHDEDLINTWYAEDRAANDQWRLVKAQKKPLNTKYQKNIESLREMIQGAPASQRRLILMRIMMDLGM